MIFSYTTTCVDLYYIYLCIYHKFSGQPVPSSGHKKKKQTKTKSSIAVYTTKETEKETSTTYCTI